MKAGPQLTLTDYRSLAEFRYQLRRFLHFSEQAARKAGLKPQHHQLLLAVKGMPDGRMPRIAELAERLQLQHHSVVELADRLAKRGLIRRVTGSEDRREVHVKLTAQGERLLSALSLQMQAELRSAAPELVAALQRIATPRSDGRQAAAGTRPQTDVPAGEHAHA